MDRIVAQKSVVRQEMITYFVPMAVSFFIGAFGYVLFQYGIRPILGYGRLKKQLSTSLNRIESAATIPENDSGIKEDFGTKNGHGDTFHKTIREERQPLRRAGVDLTKSYHKKIPYWYKLWLIRRNERLVEAVKYTMVLADTRGAEKALNITKQIRKELWLA